MIEAKERMPEHSGNGGKSYPQHPPKRRLDPPVFAEQAARAPDPSGPTISARSLR
jgi:hypothetical protein